MPFTPNDCTVIDGVAHVVVTHRGKPNSIVLLDVEDWERLKLIGRICISTYPYIQVNRTPARVHVLVMRPDPGRDVDHKFGNVLDNRKSQLRVTGRSVNLMNQRNASGHRGVYLRGKRWRAMSKLNGKAVHLGYHPTAEQAEEAVKRFVYQHGALRF